jgi:hypothetical protein
MADVESRTEDWGTLPWKDIQKNVFRLQRLFWPKSTSVLGLRPFSPSCGTITASQS